MQKKAIAVYDPSDPLEKAVQDSYHRVSNKWFDSGTCQLVADAISALKIFSKEWLDEKLLAQRVSYFFEPNLCYDKSEMVFMTYPLFLGDLVENNRIDSSLHSPVVFVTPQISHFLFPEYTKKIVLNFSKVKELNNHHFVEAGGLIISEEDVSIDSDCIVKRMDNSRLQKAAATEIDRDVFLMEEIDRDLIPGDKVWDKQSRENAVIDVVEPGVNGLIKVKYDNGKTNVVEKPIFDQKFSVV